MLYFDCNAKTHNLSIGDKVVVVDDIFVASDDEICEDFEKFLVIKNNTDAYIPEGTIMVYNGIGASGWPTFLINGYELDLASDQPIKLIKLSM